MSGGSEPGARFLFGDYRTEPMSQFGLDRGVWSDGLYGIFQVVPVIAELIGGELVKRVFRLVDGLWFGRHRQRAPHGKAVT
jgi:hypothetical protein